MWALIFCSLFIPSLPAQTRDQASQESMFYSIQLPNNGILRTHAGELRFEDSPFSGLTAAVDASARTVPVTHAAAHEASSAATAQRRDIHHEIFRKHRWDFSFEGGRFHNNIPFVFDFLLGDGYNTTGLDYTLAPFIFSFRWQLSGIHGYKMFRGTWEGSFSGTYTMIPRGPETRYFAYMMGIRRNFVQPRLKVVPYVEFRAGMGDINAKQPYGAGYGQGQDFAFTLFFDSGFRYPLNDRYSLLVGAAYMHISNLYLSEPRYLDYGINVYGPTLGIEMRVGKRRDPQVY